MRASEVERRIKELEEEEKEIENGMGSHSQPYEFTRLGKIQGKLSILQELADEVKISIQSIGD